MGREPVLAIRRERQLSNSQGRAWAAGNIDFDKFYAGESPIAGAPMVFDRMPWDIGEPQPVVVRLVEAARLRDNVLDAGCGLGENALFLAGRGYRVTGVDGSAAPLEHAREQAAARGLDVTFVQADVTTLDGLEPGFGSVLDSALYHCLGPDERATYAAALHRVTVPEAALHLFCFADADSGGFGIPNHVSQDDLHTNLGEHWDIRGIDQVDYVNAMDREHFEKRQDDMRRMGIEIDLDAMRFDEQDRLLIPMWHVHAVRR